MAARSDPCVHTANSPDLPRRSRAHDLTEPRSAVYQRAKRDLEALAGTADDALYAEAELYVTRYPDHPPDAFSDSPRRRRMRAARALAPGGWAERLLGSIEAPHGYSLHSGHLQLPDEAADPERLNDPANVALWGSAIRRELRGPLYYKLELGEGERVHCHVIAAHDAGLLQLPRDGKVIQPLHDPPGWIAYLMKPPAPYTGTNLGRWMIARRRGRLPRLSGIIGVPSRRVWGCEADRSALRVSLCPDHPSAPSAPAPDLAPDRSKIMTAEAPPTICDAPVAAQLEPLSDPPSDLIPDLYTALPAMIPGAAVADQSDPPQDRSASEAECTSLTMFIASGSIPDPAHLRPLERIVTDCPISAKSATATSAVRDAKNAVGELACVWPEAAKIDQRGGEQTKTQVCPVRDGVSKVCVLPHSYPRRVKTDQRPRKNRSAPSSAAHLLKRRCTQRVLRGRDRHRPAARGPPLRRAERRFKRPARSATRTSTLSARGGNPPRSAHSRGLLAPRMEASSMQQHPNRRRAAATAARSGFPVARIGTLPPADRQKLLDSLNDGSAALITAPGGAQYVLPITPAEAPDNG